MTCKMCLERGKTWKGSDPVCYFDDNKRNWNCATLGEIRDIVYEGQDLPREINYQYCDDDKFATLNIHEVRDKDDRWIGRCLYVAWYKNRGRTDVLWILDGSDDIPREPTEDELLSIIKYFGERKCTQ